MNFRIGRGTGHKIFIQSSLIWNDTPIGKPMKDIPPPTYLHGEFEAHLEKAFGPDWRRIKDTPDYHKLFRAYMAGWDAAKVEPPSEPKTESIKRRGRGRHVAGAKNKPPELYKAEKRERDRAQLAGDSPSAVLSEAEPVGAPLEGLAPKD